MTVELNHTLVWCRDKKRSSRHLADLLGLAAPSRFGPFEVVTADNGVSLDFVETEGDIAAQHYAFLVSEAEFDEILGRIKQQAIDFWAHPSGHGRGEINTNDGGRGVYFPDPDGHALEILTRPYGSGSASGG